MITSVFKKSTPLNLSLVVFLVLVFFFIYQFQSFAWTNSSLLIAEKAGILAVLLSSIFVSNFIVKRNGVSRDSSFTIFFYLLFVLFFPSILNDFNLVLSNFFILLALRRLISLQSLSASKEKIFDASLWIFLAAIFHFWSLVYLILVFISIIFHVARDYRNWILPFIAFLATVIIFGFFTIVFNIDSQAYISSHLATSYEINYFTSNYENAALSIYATVALFFMISIFANLSNMPLVLHSTFKKIIASFFIGVFIYIVSPHKSNDVLIFTIAPLAMLATSNIELPQVKLRREMILYVLIACSFFAFFSQL